MKPLCVHLGIRALAIDHRELENLKLNSKKDEVKIAEMKLAAEFSKLADLVGANVRICKELVLSALCLHPSKERFDKLVELTGRTLETDPTFQDPAGDDRETEYWNSAAVCLGVSPSAIEDLVRISRSHRPDLVIPISENSSTGSPPCGDPTSSLPIPETIPKVQTGQTAAPPVQLPVNRATDITDDNYGSPCVYSTRNFFLERKERREREEEAKRAAIAMSQHRIRIATKVKLGKSARTPSSDHSSSYSDNPGASSSPGPSTDSNSGGASRRQRKSIPRKLTLPKSKSKKIRVDPVPVSSSQEDPNSQVNSLCFILKNSLFIYLLFSSS